MTSAHDIASGFDRAAVGLAGVAFSCIQEARARQAAVDEEQAFRNMSAAQRLARAAHRQRAELQGAVDEAASLRAEVAWLQRELAAARAATATAQGETARMRNRALRAEGVLLRQARAA